MRATGLSVIVMIASLPALARAQSGVDAAPVIAVHPDVPTVLHLPDDIERAWSTDRGELMLQGVKSKLYIRPRPDAPAGLEAIVAVQTRTLHWIFLVRVVERVEDAMTEVTVPAVLSPEPAEQAGGDAVSSGDTLREPTADSIEPEAAAASAEPEPAAESIEPEPAEESTEPEQAASEASPAPAEPESSIAADAERAAAASGTPRFDLSVHAAVALAGVTALDVAGYAPVGGRQFHRALGLRLAASPPGAWWSVEAGIIGEQLAAPTVHVQALPSNMGRQRLRVSGPWLRWDVGLRARLGTRWMPTAYVGVGLQAHLRRLEIFPATEPQPQPLSSREDMPYSGVLTMGLGLQYRARRVLLGLDFQMRQGVPAGYRSVAALLSVGCFLEKEEGP